MKLAIMQPYFIPYLGYFQLINNADVFVIYDDIKYTKKGWINRNRLSNSNGEALVSLPIKKGSDFLNVDQRFLADNWLEQKNKIVKKISSWYLGSPYYDRTIELLRKILEEESTNLFQFIKHSLDIVLGYLGIVTPVVASSSLNLDETNTGQDKVLEICRAMQATSYINPQGGLELYDRKSFSDSGIELEFLHFSARPYIQKCKDFIPYLSVIDVLMFNDLNIVKGMIKSDFEIRGGE